MKVVSTGHEAVAATAAEEFAVVLMDVQMPGMDGLEATQLIRERERRSGGHQVVIAMTAHAMKGDSDRCLLAGMDGYLTKPVHLSALAAELSRVQAVNRAA